MTERRGSKRELGASLPGMPEWVIPAQPDDPERERLVKLTDPRTIRQEIRRSLATAARLYGRRRSDP